MSPYRSVDSVSFLALPWVLTSDWTGGEHPTVNLTPVNALQEFMDRQVVLP